MRLFNKSSSHMCPAQEGCFIKSRKCPLELDVLSQILYPTLGYPGPFCHILLFWWKVHW